MDINAVLALVKIAGALISIALGVYGLLNSKYWTLNGIGIAVLIGIVVFGLLSAGASWIEAYKAKSESREQAARTEHLLRELSRSIQPITQLSALYRVQIPPGNRTVDSYIQRLSSGIEAQVDMLRTFKGPYGLRAISFDAAGERREPLDIQIDQQSDLWPRNEEAIIGMVASSLTLSVRVRKQPIIPEKFDFMSIQSDFEADASMPDQAVLVWNRKMSELYISVGYNYDKRLWHRSGRITSWVDLYGSQIFLLPSRYENPDAAAVLIRSLELRTIALTFAEGRTIFLPRRKLKKTTIYRDRYPVFSITLPEDEVTFREFTASGHED